MTSKPDCLNHLSEAFKNRQDLLNAEIASRAESPTLLNLLQRSSSVFDAAEKEYFLLSKSRGALIERIVALKADLDATQSLLSDSNATFERLERSLEEVGDSIEASTSPSSEEFGRSKSVLLLAYLNFVEQAFELATCSYLDILNDPSSGVVVEYAAATRDLALNFTVLAPVVAVADFANRIESIREKDRVRGEQAESYTTEWERFQSLLVEWIEITATVRDMFDEIPGTSNATAFAT